MTDAELSGLLTAWGDPAMTKTEREQAHDAAAREFAERSLASKSEAAFLDVNGMRYSPGRTAGSGGRCPREGT